VKRSRRRAILRQLRLATRLVYEPSGRHHLREQHSLASSISGTDHLDKEMPKDEDSHVPDETRPDRRNLRHVAAR
jgi:hypothetical protein